MKKWIILIAITSILLVINFAFSQELKLHQTFQTMVFFFTAQAFVLFRIDYWTSREWSAQIALVKIVIRLLSSLIFILVLIYTQTDHFTLVIQFIILYLIFMIFEIVMALTNLRRN
ncbi:MAG: hypothetical protein RLN88_15530 [Ekhidna sp.]|uniref:hypothetical protein n=1 Tax=Ekhidna sp. TaxID=2608089 RepID=UPI0032EACB09